MNKNFFGGVLKKLKSIKHIEIILAILFSLIIVLVYFSSTSQLSSNKTSVSTDANVYASEIEEKLENIIGEIEGAGNVSVMVMCEENAEENTTPKIVSAVVVSSGANNVAVKLNIIKTVEALLNLNTKNIEVFQGN